MQDIAGVRCQVLGVRCHTQSGLNIPFLSKQEEQGKQGRLGEKITGIERGVIKADLVSNANR